MASRDSRTTQQLLEALGFDYNKYDHDSLVREALRELEQRREERRRDDSTWDARLTAQRRARALEEMA